MLVTVRLPADPLPDSSLQQVSMTNIGFFDGTAVVWPAAAMLSVDDRRPAVGTAFISMLKDCYESVPWEEV